jgi:HEAT repeat protein
MAARLGSSGAVALTPEQIAEDRRIDAEQVAEAAKALASPDAERRLGAVQQLGAYPTAEAEKMLVSALAKDRAEEVRAEAARSLALVKEPAPRTIEALLAAATGKSPDNRDAALETLQGYLGRLEADSAAFKKILRSLQGLARSGKLDPESRQALRDWLRDFSG